MQETKKYLGLWFMTGGMLVFLLSRDFAAAGRVGGAFVESARRLTIAEDVSQSVAWSKKSQILEPILTARAVLVKDRHSPQVLYQKSPLNKLPIASLTKLMAAIVVYSQRSMDEPIRIEELDLAVPQFRANLEVGETFLVRDLLKAMLVASGNDATMALARHTAGVGNFVEFMNKYARNLGMSDTSFANPVGFDAPTHFSTAADLSLMVEEFLHYTELLDMARQSEIVISSVDGQSRHALVTTNKLMLSHPEILGLKTGSTQDAKQNLILLTKNYYAIILGSEDRETDGQAIINWVEENWIWQN